MPQTQYEIDRKVQRMLSVIRSQIVLVGGCELDDAPLRTTELGCLLEMFARNGIAFEPKFTEDRTERFKVEPPRPEALKAAGEAIRDIAVESGSEGFTFEDVYAKLPDRTAVDTAIANFVKRKILRYSGRLWVEPYYATLINDRNRTVDRVFRCVG